MIGLLVIVFLSMVSGKVEKKSLSGVSKEQEILSRNKDKYSKHIRFYNRILNIDKGLLYYFEDAGTDKKFRTIQNEDITADIAIDKNFIDKLKELETSKEKDELDKKAIAMIPILEKMMPITDEMRTYNQFMFITEGEKIIKEIHKQELDASDFISKGNAKQFKKMEEKMDKALIKFEKSLKNTKQLEKEGYTPGDHSEFVQKANKFNQSVNVFIQRIEKKEKASHSSVSDSFFAQTEEGTPENLLANFNEVIKEHNKLLVKKTKK